MLTFEILDPTSSLAELKPLAFQKTGLMTQPKFSRELVGCSHSLNQKARFVRTAAHSKAMYALEASAADELALSLYSRSIVHMLSFAAFWGYTKRCLQIKKKLVYQAPRYVFNLVG